MTIYDDLGVRTLINARGCATLAGGTLMEPEVVAAMAAAAESFVRIGDLQEVASRRIAALTGAEAGYVTSGAAAGLTLGAAAMLARLDPDLMERLPETGSSPAEIVVQAAHRNPYDHLVRASGARLVEFGGVGAAGARRSRTWRPRSGRRRPVPSITARPRPTACRSRTSSPRPTPTACRSSSTPR